MVWAGCGHCYRGLFVCCWHRWQEGRRHYLDKAQGLWKGNTSSLLNENHFSVTAHVRFFSSSVEIHAFLFVWVHLQSLFRFSPLVRCASLLSRSAVSDSLWPPGLQPTKLLCPRDSPGKKTGVGCHFLLHKIFLIQGSNLCLLHFQQILYPLSHLGSVSSIKREFINPQYGVCFKLWDGLRVMKMQTLWMKGTPGTTSTVSRLRTWL